MQYKESDLYEPAMLAMASRPDGRIATSELISDLESSLNPTGHNAEILDNRDDTHFSQLVRNIKSHKEVPGNVIHDGLVEDSGKNEMRLSDQGFAYLVKKGHVVHRL